MEPLQRYEIHGARSYQNDEGEWVRYYDIQARETRLQKVSAMSLSELADALNERDLLRADVEVLRARIHRSDTDHENALRRARAEARPHLAQVYVRTQDEGGRAVDVVLRVDAIQYSPDGIVVRVGDYRGT